MASRLAQRIESERAGDDTLSIEIVNPCCGPSFSGYWARYVSSESDNQELRPTLVLTLEAGGGGGDLVVTTTANAGLGSLRQAILDANAQAGEQTITFNIPGSGPRLIEPTAPLPDITGPVTIDGRTQPGYVSAPNTPIVVLDGSHLVESDGLTFAAGSGGSAIWALSLTNIGSGPPYSAIFVQANDVELYRNFIGVRPNGTTPGPNGVGIHVVGSNAQIGEVDSSDENVIVASDGAGVWLEGSGAQVEENEIRAITGVAGSGNGRGVFNDGATDSIIQGNVIRGSTSGDGVVIGGGSEGVDIVGNQISANAGLGIDTRDDGVTPNNPPGPVDHENFPVLEETAAGAGGTLDVSGRFRARGEGFAGQSYRIQLFSNVACDPSGHGEGAELLAQQVSTTNSDGVIDFTLNIPGTTTGALTATATPLAAGNNRSTSEFSACLVIGGGGGTVVLDAVQASVPSTGRVPLASIPGSAFVARPPGVEASPIRDIPIRDIPIADIPIADIPIADIPIADIGFTDQLVLPLLATFSLADIPLLRPGGWPVALQGTAFATAPPQNVSLRDVLALARRHPPESPG